MYDERSDRRNGAMIWVIRRYRIAVKTLSICGKGMKT